MGKISGARTAAVPALIGLGLSSTTALAQIMAARPTSVEEIEVTAKRLDTARQAIQPSLGANQFQFDQSALAKLPLGLDISFDKVLLQAPGVTQDSYGQIHIRNEHGNVQYRLNGITLPEGTDGFGNVIDTAIAEKVVVLTGALPAQYGYRTAGVVNIDTQSGSLEPETEIGVRAGSNDQREVSARTSGGDEKFNYFLTARYLANNLGVNNPTGASSAIHDDTEQVKTFGYLSGIVTTNLRASLIFGSFDGRYQIPNVPGAASNYSYLNQTSFDSSKLNQRQRESTRFGVAALQGSWSEWEIQGAVFARSSATKFTPDIAGDIIFNGSADHTVAESTAGGVQLDALYRIADKHNLRGGVFASVERTQTALNSLVLPSDVFGNQLGTVPISIYDKAAKTGYLYGVYLQDEWSLTDKLTLNYGLRFDGVDAYTKETQLSPRINLNYEADELTSLHAGFARNFTPPPQELVAGRTLAQYANTVKASEVTQNDPVRAERENYYDVGITRKLFGVATLGLDGYYKRKKNLLDEGQFGESLINSPFNYQTGKVYGVEASTTLELGAFSAYANGAYGHETGRNIISSQFFFGRDELDYIAHHFISTDHSQTWTASGGFAYRIEHALGLATFSADMVYGSGLRKAPDQGSLPPNGAHLPAYTQVDLGISNNFSGAGWLTGTTVSLDAVNLLDKVYRLRDGTGVGVGAPQFGPRRAISIGISRRF